MIVWFGVLVTFMPSCQTLTKMAEARSLRGDQPGGIGKVGKVASTDPSIVTIFSTQCSTYHDWQTVVLYETWKRAELPGSIVRLMACSDQNLKTYRHFDVFGKSLTIHPHEDKSDESPNGYYAPLNKPWGLQSWLTQGTGRDLTDDTVLLIVDPDMAFRDVGVRSNILALSQHVRSTGVPLGLDYSYVVAGMKHYDWALSLQFVDRAHVEKLQSIGPPILIRKDQLATLVGPWHEISLEIVSKPALRELVHDGWVSAPWIAEMYGYSLAAAGMPHETQEQWAALQVPQPPWAYTGAENGLREPLLVHYSHTFHLCDKKFNKMDYVDTDFISCDFDRSKVDALLRPPAHDTVARGSCGLCLEGNEVIGHTKNTCLSSSGKNISYDAWNRVYTSILMWRAQHCPLNYQSKDRLPLSSEPRVPVA